MSVYLVTGGAGFIGSNFVYSFNEDDKVVVLDNLTYAGSIDNLIFMTENMIFVKGDICDEQLVRDLFEDYQFDYVVNFAAESHVDRSIIDSNAFVKTNVEGTNTLLTVARDYWLTRTYDSTKRFIQISTDEVYGPIDSGEFDETAMLLPTNPYAASKASADLLALSFYKTFGLPVIITRCTNNYGPRQHSEKFIPTIINSVLNNKKIPVYGDGLQTRDWLHVDDHVEGIWCVINKGTIGEIYNIGANHEVVNIDVVKSILDYLSLKLKRTDLDELIEYVEDRLGHDRRYGLKTDKLKQLGWEPFIDFNSGLNKTIDWYLESRVSNEDTV